MYAMQILINGQDITTPVRVGDKVLRFVFSKPEKVAAKGLKGFKTFSLTDFEGVEIAGNFDRKLPVVKLGDQILMVKVVRDLAKEKEAEAKLKAEEDKRTKAEEKAKEAASKKAKPKAEQSKKKGGNK